MIIHYLLVNMLLVSGLVAVPLYLFARGPRINAMPSTHRTLVRQWLHFLVVVLVIRFTFGALFFAADIDLSRVWAGGYFYPIRIAYPNWGLLKGLPYLLFCILVVMNLNRIRDYIGSSRWKYFLLWFFAAVFLLSFGGIHGGLVEGNIGVSSSATHLADIQLNSTVKEVFATHTNRILGRITPSYQAAHSLSHPAGSIAYWQVIAGHVSPFFFSVVNVLLFSIAFPSLYWALGRRFNDAAALQGTLACLAFPALLIYGRADDAVYYSLAAIVAALSVVAVREGNYFLTLAVGIVFSVAMNFSYAAVVLVAAVFFFDTELPLSQVTKYIRSVFPHLLVVLAVAFLSTTAIALWSDYHWLDAFIASVRHNESSTLRELFRRGEYGRVINDRIMAISDFLIFGGPLLLLLLRRLLVDPVGKITDCRIKDLALAALFVMLVINSNGPGEVSRPWGSLFLLIGFYWLADLLMKEDENTRWWIIKSQFWWALALQTILNFDW